MREARAQLVQDRAHNSKVRLAIGQCASGDCRVVTQNPTEHGHWQLFTLHREHSRGEYTHGCGACCRAIHTSPLRFLHNGDDKEDLSKREETRMLRRLPPLHGVRNSRMKTVMRYASKRKDLIASFQDESSPVKVALCAIIANSCGGPQQSRSRLRTVVTVLALAAERVFWHTNQP